MNPSFQKKNLHSVPHYKSFQQRGKELFSFKKILRGIIVLCAITVVGGGLFRAYEQSKEQISSVGQGTLSFVNRVIGDPMEKDEFGNINVLLLGFGGLEHRGGFLTDSIMVASFNPDEKAVTMLSIPRDLYVNKDDLYIGKINSLLAIKLAEISDYDEATFKTDFEEAELFLREKIEEVTGLTIPYYVGVSFAGFENFIDELGGLTIDVPQTLDDPYFPDANTKGYEPLLIKNGVQTFDGNTALKYARSRQTTSDFSRSYRQQQIISALIQQMKSNLKRNKLGKIEDLYQLYKKTVYTNISLPNALAMSTHQDNLEQMHSFVLSYECASSYELMEAGCVLYGPDREAFGGRAVLLPQGAGPRNISYYKRVEDFVYAVVHNQGFLNENAKIRVENAIHKEFAAQQGNYRSGRANTLARKLKQYGFKIAEIDNATEDRENILVHTYGDTFDDTRSMLQLFIDFDHEHHEGYYSGDTNIDISIELGDSFITQLNEKTHQRLHR